MVGSLKGRTLEAALRRGGRSFYRPKALRGHPNTVLGLMRQWVAVRGTGDGYFFDGCGLPRCNLDRATKRVMNAVGFKAPAGCDVSGHSPRISAFTQGLCCSNGPMYVFESDLTGRISATWPMCISTIAYAPPPLR